MTEWKDVPNYIGLYKVSNEGQVKSLLRISPANKRVPERILKFSLRYGYPRVKLHKYNKGESVCIHQLVALCFIENPEKKLEINHKDGNKLNNHVSNLEWVTKFENMQHASKIGLLDKRPRGCQHWAAKFNKEQVLFIRNNPEKLTQRQMAKRFSVTQAAISLIVKRKNYSNVD